MDINKFCKDAHSTAVKKGFWKDGRAVSELLMLVVTELVEACEADRKGDEENFKEEIANCFIRLGDLVGGLNIDIEEAIKKKMIYNETRPQKHEKKY